MYLKHLVGFCKVDYHLAHLVVVKNGSVIYSVNTLPIRRIPWILRETGSWISVPGSSESQASHSSEIFLTSKSSIDLHFLSYGAQLMLLDS